MAVAGLRPCYRYPARLPTGSFGGLGEQLRFSDALFRSSPLARQLLALPYEPVCRLAVSSPRWEAFADGTTTRQRVWAAFGQPGGAFEMVSAVASRSRDLASCRRRLRRGGAGSSRRCCRAAAAATSIARSLVGRTQRLFELVQLIAATATEYAASVAEIGTPAAAKIVDDCVAAAVVHWTQEPFEHSLSVSARVHGGYLNGLKFWAAFWREDARFGVRHLSKSIELVAPGAVVARLAELGPHSQQSGLLMTVIWEQLEALRRLLARKAAANCWSEFSHQSSLDARRVASLRARPHGACRCLSLRGGRGRARQAAHALSQARGGASRDETAPSGCFAIPSTVVPMLASAWSLLSSPVALVPWAGASLFLDAKRRREEAWLSDVNPEYEAYRREVRHSFMPFVW